ncbi:MAG TPA: class I SAM-dependent RNA methyltransferase [Acetobacteraceae bacterium]
MAARRPASTRSAADATPLRVARLGADGDGIGELADGTTAYVAGALPGELVSVRLEGKRGDGRAASLQSVTEPSAGRVTPPCRHFGVCGGCVAQHMSDAIYMDWKTARLVTALRRAGFDDVPIAPIIRTPPRVRRRMDLALRRIGSNVAVGLHRTRSTELVDIGSCDVLHPALLALIAPLRAFLASLGGLRREGSAVVNLLDNGPDLLVRTDATPTLADRIGLTAFARAYGLARVSWIGRDGTPEPVCVLRPPVVTLSGVTVTPPPGAFLQASAAGERAIVDAVLAGLPAAMPARARVAELYSGCGTLTFALARVARVRAFEGEPASCAALDAAVRHGGLAARIETQRRDLARQPLRTSELAGLAALVLDPPHAGAPAQMAAIAAARVPRVVYVSCDPAALGRDARPLATAGYRAVGLTPIDQFLWSARVESVTVFTI